MFWFPLPQNYTHEETYSVAVFDRHISPYPVSFDFSTAAERSEFLRFVEELEKNFFGR
jgi:hypothetical protein